MFIQMFSVQINTIMRDKQPKYLMIHLSVNRKAIDYGI